MARYNDGFAKMELQTIATAFDNGTMTVSTAKSRVFGYLGIDIKARTKKGFLKELANYVYSEPKQNPAPKRKPELYGVFNKVGKKYNPINVDFNTFEQAYIFKLERYGDNKKFVVGAYLNFYKDGATAVREIYITEPTKINKNPAPKRKTFARTQSAAEAYVRRPSQTTRKAPSARLKKRRTINLQTPRGVFPNPSPREADAVYAREIFLIGYNDGDLYRQRTTSIIDNLAKKYAKGQYDKAKALKLWRYWADDASKRYAAEFFNQKTGFPVNVPTRELIAAMAEESYFEIVASESEKFARKNPVRPKIAKVKVMAQSIGQKWRVIAEFPNTPKGTSDAVEYAKAYHVKKPSIAIKVEK